MQGFFEQVYRLVSQVPPGKVTSYGAIARMLGQPHAARTIGWALLGLPGGSDVPWHRVINSQGRISIGGRGHAADLQRALLEAEGIELHQLRKIRRHRSMERLGSNAWSVKS